MIDEKKEVKDIKWDAVIAYMHQRFDKDADVKEILFVIGLRELGRSKKKFTKEEKQDLMNLAVCKIFSLDGYFDVSYLDGDGWPVWKQIKPLPPMDVKTQEKFIRDHIIAYFEDEKLI